MKSLAGIFGHTKGIGWFMLPNGWWYKPREIWEMMKIVVEPSSAIVLAAIIKKQPFFKNKKIGLILSGGNVDMNNLPW